MPSCTQAKAPSRAHKVLIDEECDRDTMARGNQRDLARAKNLKKQQEAAKSQKKQGDPKKRMENDAEILRQKQAAGTYL
ncbi:hypothetical protein DIURU_003902 [Diutina rugosa]|uniref:Small EDRK-rich factor-like N-terminal domain-containing protein n=1 Tax=Diutina rugosa TaxID=5481 RepID=A0A642UJF6_DIURU|nr:uncharacterized protein DIURU_003902 [Diutina rugosa]KAA8900086.1 hypothetical protein DIURU_003902 [Diutina rugosa]